MITVEETLKRAEELKQRASEFRRKADKMEKEAFGAEKSCEACPAIEDADGNQVYPEPWHVRKSECDQSEPELMTDERRERHLQLRRWCIETALYSPSLGSTHGIVSNEYITSRAQAIYDWITR